jgi:hypothetical protein
MLEIFDFLDDVIEPETVRKYYPDASEEQINFLQAIITLMSTDKPFKDFYTFENVITALNYKVPDFTIMEPPAVEELWHGIKVMRDINKESSFSDEVIIYAKGVFNDNGVYFYPKELDSGEENKKNLKKIIDKSESGPFPLKDNNILDIQASNYLIMDLYNKSQTTKDVAWLSNHI